MRRELDFNDAYIAGERHERLSRLGSNEAEHTYLHSTLDDAVAYLQDRTLWLPALNLLWSVILTVAVIALWVVK